MTNYARRYRFGITPGSDAAADLLAASAGRPA